MTYTNNADAYQEWTKDTAIYPGAQTKSLEELMYLALGLSSEAGEVAGKCKKLYRDGDSIAGREVLLYEIGDCIWYLARLCDALDTTLNVEMTRNREKLEQRKKKGTLQGSGDTR
jgi:NTP pyrophosphatase (non-canonical NTP hydrolase)